MFNEDISQFFDVDYGFAETGEYYSDLSTKVADVKYILDIEDIYIENNFRKVRNRDIHILVPADYTYLNSQYFKISTTMYKIQKVEVQSDEATTKLYLTKDY
jgi:hypothetical protein